MKASNIYLEAFSKDISYEIAVVGMKAGSDLSNLDELSEDKLSGMFLRYIESENSKQEDNLTETEQKLHRYQMKIKAFIPESTIL